MANDTVRVDPDFTARPTTVRWLVFALACATSFVLYLHRYSWNLIGPILQRDLQLSNTQIGLLFSLFYYTYAVGQIPSGVIIDRFGPHRVLSVIIAAWSLALVGIAQTTSLLWLGISRFLFGATQAGCYPALTKVSILWFPPAQRTVLQGWVATTFGRTGAALSPIILMSWLVGRKGMSWQAAVTALGFVGLVLCLLVVLLMRDSPGEDRRVNEAERRLIRSEPTPPGSSRKAGVLPFRTAVRSSSLRWFLAQQFLDAGSDVVFVGMIGTYFLTVHKLDLKETGWLASLPLWGGAAGGIVGGWLNDGLIRRLRNPRVVRSGVGFAGKIVGCGMLIATVMQSDGTSAAYCLMFAKFFSDWSQPTTWGTCTDLGGRFSATVFSIVNTFGTAGGAIMPVIFGGVLDWFSSSQTVNGSVITETNWGPLFALLAGMYFVSGACWLMVDCTKPLQDSRDELQAVSG